MPESLLRYAKLVKYGAQKRAICVSKNRVCCKCILSRPAPIISNDFEFCTVCIQSNDLDQIGFVLARRIATWGASVPAFIRTILSDVVELPLWCQKRAAKPCMSGRKLKNRCRLHGDGLGSGAPIDARIGEAVE